MNLCSLYEHDCERGPENTLAKVDKVCDETISSILVRVSIIFLIYFIKLLR